MATGGTAAAAGEALMSQRIAALAISIEPGFFHEYVGQRIDLSLSFLFRWLWLKKFGRNSVRQMQILTLVLDWVGLILFFNAVYSWRLGDVREDFLLRYDLIWVGLE